MHVLDSEQQEDEKVDYNRKIVAITACAAGIAHTYMAAEALELAGKELGIEVIVEKQGANGIEDRITPEILKAQKQSFLRQISLQKIKNVSPECLLSKDVLLSHFVAVKK